MDETTPNDSIGIWMLSFATGSVLWIALFLGMGFGSDFGNQLTRIYGRDLQSANIDWWLFMLVLIALSMLLHVGTWIALSRLNQYFRAVITVLVGGTGLFFAVSSIAFYIDSQLLGPIALTLPTIALCEYISLRNLVLQ